MTDAETRKRFGLAGTPIKATRVLQKPMKSTDFNGQTAWCLLIIDDEAGTFTPGNTYDGNLGDRFKAIPRPLEGKEQWAKWEGRGYKPGKVTDHPALVLVKTGAPATT